VAGGEVAIVWAGGSFATEGELRGEGDKEPARMPGLPELQRGLNCT